MYKLNLVEWYLSKNNYLRVCQNDSNELLQCDLTLEKMGIFNGLTKPQSNLLTALGSMGYHCRIHKKKDVAYLDVWRPGLVVFKRVDYSILFNGGTVIERTYHYQVDKQLGEIRRGDRRQVKLIVLGQEFDGAIRNANRSGVYGNTYILQYSPNGELAHLLQKHFGVIASDIEQYCPYPGHLFEVIFTEEQGVITVNLYSEDLYEPRDLEFGQYIRAFYVIRKTLA